MSKKQMFNWSVILTVASLSSVSGVYAELVYDIENNSPQSQKVDERNQTREVLQSAEKAKVAEQSAPKKEVYNAIETKQVQAPVALRTVEEEPEVVVAPTTVVTQSSNVISSEATQNLSRSELLRRQRMREELKNEDLIQERLEELRLRDEKGRTTNILADEKKSEEAPAPVNPMLEEKVVGSAAADMSSQQVQQDSISMTQSSATQTQGAAVSSQVAQNSQSTLDAKEEKISIGITPRAGLSSMSSTSGFDIESRYSVGLGLDVGVADNLSFEIGYQFSEYGLKYAPTNTFVQWLESYNNGYYNSSSNRDTHVLKQNVFDMGIKLYLLGRDSRFRPYVGGGGGYARTYLNYDQRYINLMKQYGYQQYTSDYELSQYLGYLSTGFDIQLSKSISVGAGFKYYTVLSSSENQSINNGALLGGYYYGGYSYLPNFYNNASDKDLIGGSISRSSFYSVMAGVTFQF